MLIPTHTSSRGAPTAQTMRVAPPTPPRVAPMDRQPSSSAELSTASLQGSALDVPDEVSSAAPPPPLDAAAADPYVGLSASKVPNQKAVANVGSLPLGAMVSPFAEAGAGPVVLRRDPVRCARCLAFVSGFCKVDGRSGGWTCCFCGEDNNDALLASEDLSSYPELMITSVDYHLMSGGLGAAAYGGDGDGGGGEPTPVVFLIDECLDDDEVAALRASMLKVVRSLPGATRVGIATYAASVAVYDLSVTSGTASAEVVPGTRSPTPADLHSLLYGTGTFLAPLATCMPAVEAVIGSLRPAASAAGPVAGRPRCLGPALETAAALLKRGGGVGAAGGGGGGAGAAGAASAEGGGRVLVCTGGPATRGPGGIGVDEDSELFDFEEAAAKTYIAELSSTVASLAVSVDILAGGRAAVGAMRLAPLADASGGAILLLEDFGGSFVSNASAAARRAAGRGAALSVRTSPGVSCTRVIGAAEAMSAESAAAATAPSLPALTRDGEINLPVRDTTDVFRLKSTDPSLGLAVFLEFTEDLPADFVYLQFVVWHCRPTGERVARCMTRRVPTTGSQRAYLRAVDAPVAALLAAKKAALDAQEGGGGVGPAEAVDRLEARLLDVADVFAPAANDAAEGGGGGGAALLREFPEELSGFAEALYHMLRGPMLGRLLGHEDERAVARAHFLTAGAVAAQCMLVPRLYVWRGGAAFEAVPPADLALRSADALFLDHGTAMFCWVGHTLAAQPELAAEVRHEAAAFGERLARGRFPVPPLRVFNEGSSAARFMVARLVPLHRDAPHEQDARFPPVRLLTTNERKAGGGLMTSTRPTLNILLLLSASE